MKPLRWSKRFTAWMAVVAVPLAMTMAVGLSAQEAGPPNQMQMQDQGDVPPVTAPDQGQMPPDQAQMPGDQAQMQSNVPPVTSPDQAAPGAASHGVARVSIIDGQVTMQRGDGEWQTATVNLPLMSGDKIATAAGARTEVQLDYANVLRLDGNSQANLVTLSSGQVQLQLASGTADFVVLRSGGPTAEIDTPNMSVHPQGPGIYRIEVNSDSNTAVVVRSGEAEIATPQGSATVDKGQMIQVQGTDEPQYQIVDAPAQDAWDQWNASQDRTIEQAHSWSDTDPYYTGSADLDSYGYWTTVPGYGQVWVPDQSADWAPYSDGQWLWEPYWGWTWDSFEPWGWAPYHYGRWFVYNSAWCWWPGPVGPFYRPLWAPAYVSFFGWGGGMGFGFGFGGFGFGSIGWLPIGPGDFFHPWWGVGVGFNHIPIGQMASFRGGREIGPLGPLGRGGIGSNLGRMMTDARVRGGISSLGANQFGRARVDGPAHIGVDQLRQAQAIRGSLPVAHTAASMRGVSRVVGAPARAGATHFFGSTERSASNFGGARSGANFGGARSGAVARGGAQAGGWQRFSASGANRGGTASSERFAGNRGGSAAGANGWHSFTPGGNNNAGRSQFSGSRGGAAAGGNWQRFTPEGGSRGGAGRAEQGRQPLDMHQPIMTPRSQPGYSGGRGSSAPRSGGRSGGGRNFSGFSGSAPSFGGGSSRSFGGGSARSFGGGSGRSFSGGSARSFGGGGGRSFGGGGHMGGGGGHGRR